MKTEKAIKLKCGIVLPKGQPVAFFITDPTRVLVSHESRPGEPYRCRVTSAFKQPSLGILEDWMNDGVCETPTGHRVEPDGYGPDDSPSWLLALQLI